MFFLAAYICVLSVFHSVEGVCFRKYINPFWMPKSLTQRAAEADIVIYGNVTESPCEIPTFVYRQIVTTSPPTNATNSSSSTQQPTSTPNVNNTQVNITDICLTRGLYNVSLKVHCVIKGGSVPHVVRLRGLGFEPEMCPYRNYVYKGLAYVIFLGR